MFFGTLGKGPWYAVWFFPGLGPAWDPLGRERVMEREAMTRGSELRNLIVEQFSQRSLCCGWGVIDTVVRKKSSLI